MAKQAKHRKPYTVFHDGPLLAALELDAASALRVDLAVLERAATQVEPVARRRPDGALLYRTVELLDHIDPERAEAIRAANGPRHGKQEAASRPRLRQVTGGR